MTTTPDQFRRTLEDAVETTLAEHADETARAIVTTIWNATDDERGRLIEENQHLTAELTAYRALDLADVDGRVSASCDNPDHPTWLRKPDDTRNCPWCRVAELERERAKYVGAEPTIAEEMAYLSRCLFAVHDLCDQAKRDGALGITPEAVEQAANEEWTAATPRPALPWAALMDDEDLHDFLGDLLDTFTSDVPSTRHVLAELEKTCASWRAIAEAQHAHNTAAGPDSEAGEGQ